jgi:hypothetical protein
MSGVWNLLEVRPEWILICSDDNGPAGIPVFFLAPYSSTLSFLNQTVKWSLIIPDFPVHILLYPSQCTGFCETVWA